MKERIVRSNFLTLKRRGWRIKLKKEYHRHLLKLGLEDPDNLLKVEEKRLLDDSERSNIFSLKVNNERVILKEYKARGARKAWTNLYRPSKAMREFVIGDRLFKMGISVPEPLAVGEKRRFRLLKGCFLITREIPQAQNLSDCIKNLPFPLTAEEIREKKTFIMNLAGSIRNIHTQGFTHGDLNASHIIVGRDGFYYLDFENARLKQRASDFRWIKDLSRLNESMPCGITKTDKVRFYKEYARGNRAKGRKIRRYLRRIESRTLKKMEPRI